MSTVTEERRATKRSVSVEERESIIVRFVGDSGDGMQLVGGQFTNTAAVFGNDVSTFPDFPAEIRAPAGTLAGVSGFQVHFSSHDIRTPGDELDALVAMNPAALKTNLKSLKKGGVLIVNSDSFTAQDLKKAGYTDHPLEQTAMADYRVYQVAMTRLNREAVGETTLSPRAVDRCKNLFALGLVYWLFDHPMDTTVKWIEEKFAKVQDVMSANLKTLRAGYNYGETVEAFTQRYHVSKATIPPGTYRQVTGSQAISMGMVTAAKLSGKELVYATYPITPASDILHELAKLKNYPVRTLQMEDEIAAIGAAIGASYGGAMGVTGTSGPGLALKSEAIGLAVMTELPVVIVNVQRGGPSTGLPTKTEQADLLQALYGRNGECPVPVLSHGTPAEGFEMIQEAFRIAIEFMTPVLFLSDGYLANSAEPWRIPKLTDLVPIAIPKLAARDGETAPFLPYARDDRLARPWAFPGLAGYEHRIGGLEKEHRTGNVSYDGENHEFMVRLRQRKVDGIAEHTPLQTLEGPDSGDLLVVSWGSTYGAVSTAVARAQRAGRSVAHMPIRYLNPFPKNLPEVLGRFRKILVAELNLGQLRLLLRARYLVDAQGYNKVKGQPFTVTEVLTAIEKALAG